MKFIRINMNEKNLTSPITEKDVRRMKIGDILYVTGTIITARDRAHKRMTQYLKSGKKIPFQLSGFPIYHCGPLVRKVENEWIVLAAGPTTSMRMEPFSLDMLGNLGVKAIIGKGGMAGVLKKL